MWILSLARNRGAAQCADRHFCLVGECLEDRSVPATLSMPTVTISAQEQLLLELVNRARANPLAEAARYGLADLNQGLASGTISSSAKQALAPNQALANAASAHSLDMLNNDYFSHTNLQGLSPSARAQAAGYSAGAGENIAWGGSTGSINQNQHVLDRHRDLFLSAGHRGNILYDSYRELGTGVRYGVFNYQGVGYNSSMVTEAFGNRGGNVFITGVAYRDNVVDDNFYTIGEASGGVTITATPIGGGDSYVVQTGASGGYALQVPAGTYTVTASGGGVSGLLSVASVVVNGSNVKVDFDTLQVGTPLVPATPEGPPLVVARSSDGTWWVTRSASDGQSVTQAWGHWSTAVNWLDVHTVDVDGDGNTDIVGRTQWGDWWVARAAGDHFVNEAWGSWSYLAGWQDVHAADLNGDLRTDLVGRTSWGDWWVAISNGNSFTNQRWGNWSTAAGWQDVSVGDFNGDGRSDLIGKTSWGEWWVAQSSGTAFVNSAWGGWSTTAGWRNLKIADFNGDGRDDVMGQTSNGGWWLARSTGTAFISEAWGSWSTAVTWNQVLAADIDGDGDADLLGQTGQNWWLGRSDANRITNIAVGSSASLPAGSTLAVIDLDGNGPDDLLVRLGTTEWWVGSYASGQLQFRRWGTAQISTAATDHLFAQPT